jgi:hypothetical protein
MPQQSHIDAPAKTKNGSDCNYDNEDRAHSLLFCAIQTGTELLKRFYGFLIVRVPTGLYIDMAGSARQDNLAVVCCDAGNRAHCTRWQSVSGEFLGHVYCARIFLVTVSEPAQRGGPYIVRKHF